MTTKTILFLLLAALWILVVVVLLPRLRGVSLDALHLGPVRVGAIRFAFWRKSPRASAAAGPVLPPRTRKRSRPRIEKSGTSAKRGKAKTSAAAGSVLPSRTRKRSRRRVESRTAKSGASTKREKETAKRSP